MIGHPVVTLQNLITSMVGILTGKVDEGNKGVKVGYINVDKHRQYTCSMIVSLYIECDKNA